MVERTLIPSSQWLYFKIYTGTKSADKILKEIIKPYVSALMEENVIRECFFIRYYDPDFHIRLRLKIRDEKSFNLIFKTLNRHFSDGVDNGLILNIQLDTYKREIERYGNETMESCESYFAIDSKYIIDLLGVLDNYTNSDELRWLSGLVMLDDMLDAFCPTLEDKKEQITKISGGFCKEHGMETAVSLKPLKIKYRENKKIIEKFLKREFENKDIFNVLEKRKQHLGPVTEKIIEDSQKNNKSKGGDILPSLIHMTMNRLFRANNRLCETVVYFLLKEYYTSAIARSKYQSQNDTI